MTRLMAYINASLPRALVLAAALAAAGLLAAALVAQYGFGLHPCELCLSQRYPYAAIGVLGVAALALARSDRAFLYVAYICLALFVVDAGIAAYHAGVEGGWFPGPSACTSHAAAGETLEEMRRAIMEAPLVPCDQPMAHVLGLSLAAWNAIAAASLGLGMAVALWKIRHAAR